MSWSITDANTWTCYKAVLAPQDVLVRLSPAIYIVSWRAGLQSNKAATLEVASSDTKRIDAGPKIILRTHPPAFRVQARDYCAVRST